MAEKRKILLTMLAVGKKRAHNTHTFEAIMDILKHIDSGEGRGEIACSLGLSRSTVSTIVKN
jgi:DNA-binding NarL/FixJ family response regulator